MTADIQDFHRVGVPIMNFVYIGVTLVVFLITFLRTDPVGAVPPELSLSRMILMIVAFIQIFVAVFWFISLIALPAVLLATLPLVTLWAFRTMDSTMLKWSAAIGVYLLYNIIGFGNNTLFHALRTNDCVAFVDDKDYCKDSWISFLSFLLLCYEFATLTVILGSLYFVQQLENKPPQKLPPPPQQESCIELLSSPQARSGKETESAI